MKHPRRTIAAIATAMAISALAAVGEADANHFILPCDEPCTAARWTETGSLNVPRDSHTATLLPDGRVLVAGGRGPLALAITELYDPTTGTWSLTGSMSVARVHHTATLLSDGRVLVAGGDTGSVPADFGRTASAEIYDPVTGTWHPAAPMSTRRSLHASVRLDDGSVLVAGGADYDFHHPSDILASAERYDPATDAWSRTGDLNVARYWHAMTVLDSGEVLIAGGSDSDDLEYTVSDAELYDPRNGEWRRAADAPAGGVFQPAAALPDGSVLLTGGYGGGWAYTVFDAALRFDPESQTWNRAAGLLAPRWAHTATALASGHVLIAGGMTTYAKRQTLGTTERFDPATGTWESAASLAFARSFHTATLLTDGRVLVAGGNYLDADTPGHALASAEVYSAPIASRQVVAPQAGGRSERRP